MDTPSLTPLDSGLRCDAPAACPAPDQIRTFLDALEAAPGAALDLPFPAADQPATPETLRVTLESLIATQASFTQSVTDFQEAAAPLLKVPAGPTLSLSTPEAPAVSAPEQNLTRPGVKNGQPLPQGEVGPTSKSPRPDLEVIQPLPQGEALLATPTSLAEVIEDFAREQGEFAESTAQLQAAMAPILAMPLQATEAPQAIPDVEVAPTPARVAERADLPQTSPVEVPASPTPQPLPVADLATTLRDFAATQSAFAESSQALQAAIATFLAKAQAPVTEAAPIVQSAPRAEASAPAVSPVVPEVAGQPPPAATPDLATTLRDFAATQAVFTESVATFQELIRPILAQQVAPEVSPAQTVASAVPTSEAATRAPSEMPVGAKAEALPRETKTPAPEAEPGKVVFMAIDTPMAPAAAVQPAPQTEAPVQTPPTATTVRETLPAAVTEAVEAVARALIVEPTGTVVVRLSEATLAGSEVRLEVHEGKLSVAFAPATAEVCTLLQQQQEALTTQLAERFAGRWQVAVTIHESWRRKEEVRR